MKVKLTIYVDDKLREALKLFVGRGEISKAIKETIEGIVYGAELDEVLNELNISITELPSQVESLRPKVSYSSVRIISEMRR
jgi:hypothetical protein